MDKKHFSGIVIALFIIGLFLRIAFMGTHANADMLEYARWGENVHRVGLSAAFEGGYFPVQYLSLGAAATIAGTLHASTETIIRVFNLLFEIGGLCLLAYIVRRYMSLRNVLIFFWLNPFALVAYQQGYVDPQFTFFILLTMAILMTRDERFTKYLLAGIPIGIALQMKPQAAPLFVGLAILAVLFLTFKKWREPLKILVIFIVPAVLYIAFSLYFGLTIDIYNNHKTLPVVSQTLQQKIGLSKGLSDIAAGSTFLTGQYIFVATKRMPAINALMPNPWFFVANAVNKEHLPIYRVSDTLKVFGIQYRTIGFLLFMAATITILLKIFRSDNALGRKMLLAICFIPVILPYLTTSAHDNHFYLGFIAVIIIGALLSDRFILRCGYALAALNAANTFVYYVIPYYSHTKSDVATLWPIVLASSIVFLVLLYHVIFKMKAEDYKIREPINP